MSNEESRCPVLYCLSNGWISERSQGRQSTLFIVHNAGDGSMRNRYFNTARDNNDVIMKRYYFAKRFALVTLG